MKKGKLLALLLACAVTCPARAQNSTNLPFAGESTVTSQLFSLDTGSINYRFTAALQGGNFLIVEWQRISDWPDDGGIGNALTTAAKYVTQLSDSFKEATTAKRLDIHIPVSDDPVTVMITEHPSEHRVQVFSGGHQSALKINMDTIRVLKTIREQHTRESHRLVQIQYTFLVRDIDDIKMLNQESITHNIGQTFDSIVNSYKHKWIDPDKWTHNLAVSYFPDETNPKKRITTVRRVDDNADLKFYHAPELDFGLGACSFRNTICPLFDIGVNYKWAAQNHAYTFVRLSFSEFYDFVWDNSVTLKEYEIFFANVELGGLGNTNKYGKNYGASIGFGFRIPSPDVSTYEPLLPASDPNIANNLMRFFCSFHPSPKFKLTFDVYGTTNFKHNEANPGFLSISGMFRIL